MEPRPSCTEAAVSLPGNRFVFKGFPHAMSGPSSLKRHNLSPAEAGLTATDTTRPGWLRNRRGKGWSFSSQSGDTLSGDARERCVSLAIPPAWQSVWINPDPRGHIQAYGEDADGRRQYIYHPDWRAAAEAAKFADLPRFAERLPRMRSRIRRILTSSEDEHVLALATVVGLMDTAGLRIGSRRHQARTGAVGAVTLCRKHLRFEEDAVTLHFRGKSGKDQRITVDAPELCGAIGRLADSAESSRIFDGEGRMVREGEVNAFIHDIAGLEFSAKDFRTWGGSAAAAGYLRRAEEPTISGASEAASSWLGNTPAIARNSYIHPAVIEQARSGERWTKTAGPSRLRVDERAAYALIAGR